MFRADLHCHSTCSDGSLTPRQLLELALEQGLSGLSITDHDTVAAYPGAFADAEELGLKLLTGVEFSAEHKGESIHVLAYGFPHDHPHILSYCVHHAERRQKRADHILNKLKKHGMRLDLGNPQQFHSLGRPHIAQAMVKKGYAESIQDAFKRFLGESGSCFVPGEAFSVEETLDVISAAGGFSVLAHPILIRSHRVLKELLTMPFDGLEAYYAKFTPPQERKYVQMARERGWIITGGSDFHGDPKPDIPLGASWVSEETFSLLQRLDANYPS